MKFTVFIMPKRAPGRFQVGSRFNPLNEVLQKGAVPLPFITDILHRKARYRFWSYLELVDGYHQMYKAVSDRHLTCILTQCGTMQWRLLSMGLENV